MTATAALPSNVFTRDDTFLGICQAIGEDFGFNPNWLRVALAAPLIWYPAICFGIYGALGVAVLISRFALPTRPWRKAKQLLAAERAAAKADTAQPNVAVANDEALAEVLAAAA